MEHNQWRPSGAVHQVSGFWSFGACCLEPDLQRRGIDVRSLAPLSGNPRLRAMVLASESLPGRRKKEIRNISLGAT